MTAVDIGAIVYLVIGIIVTLAAVDAYGESRSTLREVALVLSWPLWLAVVVLYTLAYHTTATFLYGPAAENEPAGSPAEEA